MVDIGYWSVKDIAEYLQISITTVISEIKRGKLKAIRIGDTYRIKKEDFEQYLSDNEYKAK